MLRTTAIANTAPKRCTSRFPSFATTHYQSCKGIIGVHSGLEAAGEQAEEHAEQHATSVKSISEELLHSLSDEEKARFQQNLAYFITWFNRDQGTAILQEGEFGFPISNSTMPTHTMPTHTSVESVGSSGSDESFTPWQAVEVVGVAFLYRQAVDLLELVSHLPFEPRKLFVRILLERNFQCTCSIRVESEVKRLKAMLFKAAEIVVNKMLQKAIKKGKTIHHRNSPNEGHAQDNDLTDNDLTDNDLTDNDLIDPSTCAHPFAQKIARWLNMTLSLQWRYGDQNTQFKELASKIANLQARQNAYRQHFHYVSSGNVPNDVKAIPIDVEDYPPVEIKLYSSELSQCEECRCFRDEMEEAIRTLHPIHDWMSDGATPLEKQLKMFVFGSTNTKYDKGFRYFLDDEPVPGKLAYIYLCALLEHLEDEAGTVLLEEPNSFFKSAAQKKECEQCVDTVLKSDDEIFIRMFLASLRNNGKGVAIDWAKQLEHLGPKTQANEGLYGHLKELAEQSTEESTKRRKLNSTSQPVASLSGPPPSQFESFEVFLQRLQAGSQGQQAAQPSLEDAFSLSFLQGEQANATDVIDLTQ